MSLDFRRYAPRLVAASVFALAVSRANSAEVLLRRKFREGEQVEQRVSMKNASSTVHLGQEFRAEQTFEIDGLLSVRKVHPDGRADVEYAFERIRARMHLPPEPEQEYDSKAGKKFSGPLSGTANELFDALLSGKIAYRVTRLGPLEDLKLPPKVAEAVRGTRPGGPAPGFFSEQGLEQLLDSLPSFPEEPVSEGKTWTKETEVAVPIGRLTITSTYRYEGRERKDGRDLERIGIRNEATFRPGERESGVEVRLRSFRSSGRALFDAEAGRFEELHVEQKAEMEIALQGTQRATSVGETAMTVRIAERK
ncbi:MAG: hypothetical protein ACUVYA_05120 [Planctomycetota bacterium]